MQEFVLIFRNSVNPHANPSPEELQERMQWLEQIVARQQLVDKGNALSVGTAKTVKPGNVVTDGPFTEIREFISGYVIIKAATIDEAVEWAQANPSLKAGGTIEVRALLKPEDKSTY
ncbi:YciI family protein [Chitinophaga nivalis]|uniref:YciI family protein n=1 Tax=Chitinophaga nivalis TaxID=2991709 RepID=A0ABT3IH29_9BACT|nr:YciI family protein [Chitinophaga nivalis]MCW3467055.1 YciI family protein [Chitinophaga nivalis]MCW3483254.1 YciI family protein [Chitinophaga nivalis]